MLAVAPFVGGGDDAVGVTTDAVAADGTVVRAAALGTPSGVRELLSETTTTLVEATGATTSATSTTVVAAVPPSTSTPAAAAADEEGGEEATTTTTEAAPARALHTEPSRTEEATTTAAPAPTTTTTAAPTTTTTTTTAPAPAEQEASEGRYAYDDPRSTQVWYDLAECESGGDWSIDTGNGYYGGLQFSLPTWESVGGSGYPHEHPAATQIELGRRLQARQGWGAWPHCSEELGLR